MSTSFVGDRDCRSLALTVRFAVSVALEYAVDPPLAAVSTLVPAVPVVWSQARNVTASVTLPLKFPLAWK